MKKKAVFAGSFDPITNGHIDIINKALPLFDEIIIGIGVNSDKKYLFSIEERQNFIANYYQNEHKILIETYTGLTGDFCKKHNAQYLIRGIRNTTDFEFEKNIAQVNSKVFGIETVFLISSPELSFLSSSIVRDFIKNKGNYQQFMPPFISEKK